MKKIGIILIFFLLFSFTSTTNESTSVFIGTESQLVIKGTTNVSSFKCMFKISEINKPIPLHYKVIDDKMVFEKAQLVLNNDCFDCGHRGMNKDFLALLKSDDYPEILLELKEIITDSDNPLLVKAAIKVHLAGKTKLYYMPITLNENEDISVSGTLKLNIGDFDLEAPKKALGLIVVSDDIEIQFDMIFKECRI